VSLATLHDYAAREVGGFIGGPLLLMVLMLDPGWWPFLLLPLLWLGFALHMFTGWRPKKPRKR
jgi:hypothetical protein